MGLGRGRYAERATAVEMLGRLPKMARRRTVAGDKAYDTKWLVANVRALGYTPHVAPNTKNSAIDSRTTRHAGHQLGPIGGGGEKHPGLGQGTGLRPGHSRIQGVPDRSVHLTDASTPTQERTAEDVQAVGCSLYTSDVSPSRSNAVMLHAAAVSSSRDDWHPWAAGL